MKIRKYRQDEIDRLIDIWYEGSLQAHSFIDARYWTSQIKAMKEIYIPNSDTQVIVCQTRIIGFLSMVDDYLAALFIDVDYQHKGAGKALLDFEKKSRNHIHLNVYRENSLAIQFYRNNGFVIKGEKVDEQTKELEYLMKWVR